MAKDDRTTDHVDKETRDNATLLSKYWKCTKVELYRRLVSQALAEEEEKRRGGQRPP